MKYGFGGITAESLNETCGGFYELSHFSKGSEAHFGNLEACTVFNLLGFSQNKPSLFPLKEIISVKDICWDAEAFQ